jgi:dTDP-L-rhamnose 4-epimerase
VLITGGLGSIGRACVPRLLAAGCEIRVLDALEPSVHGPGAELERYRRAFDAGDALAVCCGSVADRALLAEQLEGVDAVLHLAALVSVPGSMRDSAAYVEANITGTAQLADLLSERPEVARVVLASSRAVYGEGPYGCPTGCPSPGPWEREPQALARAEWTPICPACRAGLTPLPADEDNPPHPVSVYGVTKLAQERLLEMSQARHAADVVVFRLQNVYGPGLSRAVPDVGVANILAQRVLAGETLRLFEDGGQLRDFVLMDDVADLLVAATLCKRRAARFDLMNVGFGTSHTLRELAERLFDAAGVPRRIEISGEYRVGDVRHCIADTARLAKTRRWSPTPLDEGLAQLLRWLRR